MGGEGSGRKPDPVKALMGFNQPVGTPGNESFYLPNTSAIKPEAIKQGPAFPSGGGSSVYDISGQSFITLNDDSAILANSQTLAASETDPVFMALSGGFLTAETDPVFMALSGSFLTSYTETDPVFMALSGSLSYIPTGTETEPVFLATSGSYLTSYTESDPVFMALSGSFLTAETDPVFMALSGGFLTDTNTGTFSLDMTDDTASAFSLKQGANSYMCIDTSNGSEQIRMGCLAGGAIFTLTAAGLALSGAFTTQGNSVVYDDVFQTLSGAYTTHAGDSSDPHGATLTQTNVTSSGQVSGAAMFVTSDYTTSGSARIFNHVLGTNETPPTASGFVQGTIYIQYTP